MCGRYNLGIQSASELARLLQAELFPEDEALYLPRYNVAPTNVSWIVRLEGDRRVLRPARWGFNSTTGRFLINARSETAASRPAFRDSWKSGRCVVPSTGFYEWRGPPKRRRPIWFHPPDGGLLLLGGLFRPPPREGEDHPSYVILTTEANALVVDVHDRMPAILRPDEVEAWLSGPAPAPPKPPPTESLVATPASSRLNSVANDDAELLVPDPPEEQPSQLDLFGGG